MFRNSQQRWKTTSTRRYRTTFQSNRFFVFSACRYETPNLSSKNYYEILGLERTATSKEIKKAFFKLSKQYHPDSNASDQSLHEKFVKINEAFGVLSKQSSRAIYDQTLDSPSRPSYSPPPSPSRTSSSRANPYRRPTTNSNESDWGTPHFDRTFYDLLRRRMEQDRQRAKSGSKNTWPSQGLINPYLGPFSLISFLIGFGILIHTLKGRMVQFEESRVPHDPRSRNYLAYREWQRLSALKDAQSMPMRERSKVVVDTDEKST